MATEKGEPAPAEIMREMAAAAPVLNKLAAELTARIKAFEDQVSQIPGRVETTWSTAAPDGGHEWTLVMRFHRVGARWLISYGYYVDYAPEDLDWKPLIDGSIETKLAAINTFPQLLTEMRAAQTDLESRLREAHGKIDALAAQLKAWRKAGA
jgi:hypothetical protein